MTRGYEIPRLFRVMMLFLLVFAQVVPTVAFAEKSKPDSTEAEIAYVMATNGMVRVAFAKAPMKAPVSRDFRFTQTINGAEEVEVEVDSFRYVEAEGAVLVRYAPLKSTDKTQNVLITAEYKGRTKKAAEAFTVKRVATKETQARISTDGEADTKVTIMGIVEVYNGIDPRVPVAGVPVSVQGTNTSVITDENGRFMLTNLEPGTIILDFDGDPVGLRDLTDMYYYAEPGDWIETGPFHMPSQTCLVAGRVVDDSGAVIADATATITHDSYTRSTTTDAKGNFRFDGLPQEEDWANHYSYTIEISKDGYPSKTLTAEPYFWEGTDLQSIVLYDEPSTTTGSIAGEVWGTNGLDAYRLAGVTVNVQGTNLSAVTDEYGFYLIKNVPPGDRKLESMGRSIGHSNTVGETVPVVAGELVTYERQHLTNPNCIVTGIVKGDGNQLLAGVTVELYGNQSDYHDTVTTDVYGRYRFDNVPPEEASYPDYNPYRIMASKEGYAPTTIYGVYPYGGSALRVDPITLLPSSYYGTVTGTVIGSFGDQIYPLAGLRVFLTDIYNNILFEHVGTTDEQGNFTIQNIPDGDYGLFYSGWESGYEELYSPERYQITGAQIITAPEVALPRAAGDIAGVMTNHNGAPLKNVEMELYNEEYGGRTYQATTDATGAFLFKHVYHGPEGITYRYKILASVLGYENLDMYVTPVIGETLQLQLKRVPSTTIQFNQNEGGKGGYLTGAYQNTSYQPSVYNWTRQSTLGLNKYAKQIWKHQLEGATTSQAVQASSTVIDRFGTVYLSATNTYTLYAINPDGTQKWKFTGSGYIKDPAIGADGTIYAPTSNGYLYAVNPNGTLKWSYKTQGYSHTAPVIGADGTIYIGSTSGNLYALNPNGTLKWKSLVVDATTTLNAPYRGMAIGADGTIYAAINTKLYALTSTGATKWSYTAGGMLTGVALDSTGVIYSGSYDNYMHAINANGTLKWKYYTANDINSSVAIGADGTLYFGSNDFNLYALNPNGTKKWSYKTGGAVYSTPLLDDMNGVWFGSSDGKLYRLTTSGSLDTSYTLGGRTWSSPSLSITYPFERIYIAADDNAIYAFSY
ncbi:carboxypeptidase regulatory-like domain-containing protein [Brevibacillus dissolubilis]|uniref:carboxypeptidase regulatory-like domain-containing protein n=1 Tax=Brevibacillus dissolubilis TaxID=1844116 RepID=UPI00159BA134|nr:carboxypeptidase regulatory-like domain-containing protein [Brevibacillus dissolubilis]